MDKKISKIGVLLGGISSEREISLISGKEVVKALTRKGYKVQAIEINRGDMEWINKIERMDVCFIALHGKLGEDGTVQGMLELFGVPYVGCGVLASALGMNKLMFRKILDGLKINYPKTIGLQPKKFPVFVKPNCGGSSVGVTKVKKIKQFKSALDLAYKFDQNVIVEEAITGREFTCGVIGNKKIVEVLPIIEIISNGDFFDYEAKYFSDKTQEVVPANINVNLANKIQNISKLIFNEIGAKGMLRIDFMVDNNNLPYVLEINTIPGLTSASLMPKAAMAAGYSYEDLLEKVIRYSL